MKRHLALFDKGSAQRILNGQKTIESRFSKNKISPYGEVEVGDLVLIKPVGGEVLGQFLVKGVIYFAGLTENDWKLIKDHYLQNLSLAEKENKFLKDKASAQFGTLIFIGMVESFLTSPVKLEKKDRRSWIVLDQG